MWLPVDECVDETEIWDRHKTVDEFNLICGIQNFST
jgi:hypothetical protein